MNTMNKPEYYELQFMQVLPYESEFGWSMEYKVQMIDKICAYLNQRNILVRFSDRIVDDIKQWTRPEGASWRPVEVGELCGNMIVINPRNIDFLSVLLTITHIYGHLVQRETPEKYEPITRFVYLPKPLDLSQLQEDYAAIRPGCNYQSDFRKFEEEAFGYGKHALLQAGISFNEKLDHALQSYIEADFNELWKWCVSAPNKAGEDFVAEFARVYSNMSFPVLEPIPVEITVVPDPDGILTVVRT